MQKELINTVESFFNRITKADFNIGTFINDFEQQVFIDYSFNREPNNSIKNILITRMDAVGDYILTTPFIRGIRKNYPNANIILVVSSLIYNLAKTNKYVDEVYIFDGSLNDRILEFTLIEILQFCSKYIWFKDNKFRQIDIAFSPQCGGDCIIPLLLSYFSGSPKRIGFGTAPYAALNLNIKKLTDENIGDILPNYFLDSFVLTDVVLLTKEEVHEVEKYTYLLKLLDLKLDNTDLELNITNDDINNVKKYINPNKKNIIVNIGSSQNRAIYDINKLNTALKLIGDNNYIFIGGINDLDRMKNITIPHINLVGRTTWRESAAIISLSDLYIGNDTGVMHMAAAFKIPILEISREAKDKTYSLPKNYSSMHRFHPWNSKYIIVQPDHALDKCKDTFIYGGCASFEAHCINQIQPEEIAYAYKQLIKNL